MTTLHVLAIVGVGVALCFFAATWAGVSEDYKTARRAMWLEGEDGYTNETEDY